MAAPPGNKNALGNKGNTTYHPSHKQIKADAELLREMFLGELSREEVQAKLKSGKYSLKDLFVSKGYAGNERVLLALFNKNFPDDILTAPRAKDEDATLALQSVKSIADVAVVIEATIKGVQAGTMSAQEATNIGRLASTALKAIQMGELDQKMDLVNSVLQTRLADAKIQKANERARHR